MRGLGYLRDHIAAVHEGKKPHKCSICDYRCAQKTNLNRHILSVHQGIKRPKQNKLTYPCDLCDYVAARRDKLKVISC